MSKLLQKKLETKTKEELLAILEGVLTIKGVADYIKLNYLSSSADKLKIISKSFAKFLRRTRFHDYYEAIQFFNDLTEEVLLPLEVLIKEAPRESATFLQVVVDSFSKL